MLDLIWTLLNASLFIWFLALCFKAAGLVRKQFGLLATLVLVAGLFSFTFRSKSTDDKAGQVSFRSESRDFVSTNSLRENTIKSFEIELEDNTVSKYNLWIQYGKDKNTGANVPFKASSTQEGLGGSVNWKPLQVEVGLTNDNNKFRYLVYGIEEWKLLGFTLYSDSKEYKGIVSIK